MSETLPMWVWYTLTSALIIIMVLVWMQVTRWQIKRKVAGKVLVDIWRPSGRKIALVELEASPKEGIYTFEYDNKIYNFYTSCQVPALYPPVGLLSKLGTTVMAQAFEENIPEPMAYRASGKYDPKNTGEVIKARVGQRTLEISMHASKEVDELQKKLKEVNKMFIVYIGLGILLLMVGIGLYLNYTQNIEVLKWLQVIGQVHQVVIP